MRGQRHLKCHQFFDDIFFCLKLASLCIKTDDFRVNYVEMKL